MIWLAIGSGFGVLVAGAAQNRWRWLQVVCRRALISYTTLALMFLAAEGYLRRFYTSTDTTLARHNWNARYWHENSRGYRDREWTAADLQGREVILVAGDSFTAGWGIEDAADRYTDVLQARLGDDYAVINIGQKGSPSLDILRRVRDYPAQPDTLILQYFLNDIDSAASSLGMTPPDYQPPRWTLQSHVVNLAYERYLSIYRLGPQYWEWRYAAYDNWRVWEAHEETLQGFVDYAASKDARLIVLIFPNMQDPVSSIPYVDRVADVFEAYEGVEVMKLFDDVAAWDTATQGPLIVSPWDAHPSVAFHHHIGDKLYRTYFSGGG